MMQSTESIVRNNAPGVCGTNPPHRIKQEGSIREAEALAADIWEVVLRSVAKAV